ncbi:TetR/AcrR family transcriptional regulator [Halobellus rufus]|uniref:TetR/AcrR family transcriptional regulator n=1 Tax=Halobellus rufus TaxID=1448860 RepID=UPI0006799D12|nr:TetR/AcrR family transcriptional regulator [Halobellus rufus]
MTEDTATDILHATHDALCTHGYAEVTMQDIADEAGLCKASIHYHYDGKHELLLAYLDHLYERFEDRLTGIGGDAPEARLHALLDAFVTGREDAPAFRTALLEIKAQSPYDSAFRDRLERFDEAFSAELRSILEDGVESGAFREDVDPDAIASFLTTFVNGVQTRQVGVGHPPEASAAALRTYIDETLRPSGSADEVESGTEPITTGRSTE